MKKSLCTKKLLCLVLALIMCLGLCACGSKYAANDSASPAAAGDMFYASSPAEAPDPGYAFDDGFSYGSTEADVPLSGSTQRPSLPDGVKLIYTASISMESTEFDRAVSALDKLVADMGGYFESSSLDNYDYRYRYAHYTVRIPAENFSRFCDNVGELCQVNNISRNAQDVSEVYYDTASRLETQQTKLARLQELLSQAKDMADIITIESAISETEYNIESLTGTLRHYDSLVGYSTVDISLSEVYKLSDVEEPVVGFGAKLAAAFKRGCTSFVDSLQYGMLSFARNWTGWLIFAIIVAAAAIVTTRTLRRRRERRNNKDDQ